MPNLTSQNRAIAFALVLGLALGTILWWANYRYQSKQHDSIELIIDPMRQMPEGNCLYMLSTKPHSSFNGHLNIKCGSFKPYNRYEIVIKKPY